MQRVDSNTPVENEPKFLVFYTMLLSLFSMFCFNCKMEKHKVENGHCENPFTWRSQSFVLGRYPAGNVLLGFAVLMAGASISKVLLVFWHMGLSIYCIRTYFKHQKKFIYPVILHYWETYRASLTTQLKKTKDGSGDVRFDSMGHNAKYGAFTMFCSTLMKIVRFKLLQVKCFIFF